MIRLTFMIIALTFTVSGCINQYGTPPRQPDKIKFTDLSKDASRWEGKMVEIEGTFNFEFEGDAIFATKEDQKQKNRKKAISLVLDSRTLGIPDIDNDNISIWRKIFVPLSLRSHNGKSIVVTGIFQSASFGGLYVGTMMVKQLVLK